MKDEAQKTDHITGFLFFITIFMSMGWYFAESENELLRQELALKDYTKPVQIKEIQHDR